ncbi:MAG: PspC domain-containing protein [Terracidiphilus sp.]
MGNFCSHCGIGLPPTARFCSSCGAVVAGLPFIPGRRLVRVIAGRQIAGVCAGLAQTYGWDLTLVRVIAVLSLLCSGGTAAIAYVVCWIAIPEEHIPLV